MIDCATTDLPEPDSPTSATVPPGRDAERHAVDRLHRAGVDVEINLQIPDREKVSHAPRGSIREGLCQPRASERPRG